MFPSMSLEALVEMEKRRSLLRSTGRLQSLSDYDHVTAYDLDEAPVYPHFRSNVTHNIVANEKNCCPVDVDQENSTKGSRERRAGTNPRGVRTSSARGLTTCATLAENSCQCPVICWDTLSKPPSLLRNALECHRSDRGAYLLCGELVVNSVGQCTMGTAHPNRPAYKTSAGAILRE